MNGEMRFWGFWGIRNIPESTQPRWRRLQPESWRIWDMVSMRSSWPGSRGICMISETASTATTTPTAAVSWLTGS